jgi:dihydroorotate dehydrogenase
VYSFFRSLLFRLDPESAHHLTLSLLRLAGFFAPARWILEAVSYSKPKPVIAFGCQFTNPVGLAAGYDKDAMAVRGLAALGFGHLELGTVTPLPQAGNPRPRLFRLVEDQAVINRMGFPSRGSAFVMRRLERLNIRSLKRDGVLLGINLGKNKETPNEQAVFDYLSLLQNFSPYADYLAINISSPNTPGLRELQSQRALETLLTQLDSQRGLEEKRLEKRLPLLVKLAPDLSDRELDEILEVVLRTHMNGLILTNTTVERGSLSSQYQHETGGLSGTPLAARSEAILGRAVTQIGAKIPVVSVGGIQSAQEARRRLDMGAALVQIYTGLVYKGPGLVKQIVNGL